MTTTKELQKIFEKAVENAGGASAWARQNGFFKQRGNIDRMYSGKRKLSKKVISKLGFKPDWQPIIKQT